MRRLLAILLIGATVLISACTTQEHTVEAAIQFRASLVQAGGCNFQTQVEADFGDSVEEFSMQCSATAEGTAHIVLTAPETLEGISAEITDSSGKITYDGMSVDFGLLANGNVIPAVAPAILADCWCSEYISSAGEENGIYRVTYEKNYDEKRLLVDTWFKNKLPIYAEVCYNNQRILKLTIPEFTLLTDAAATDRSVS